MMFLNFKNLQKIICQPVRVGWGYSNTKVNKKATFGPFKQSPFKNIHFSSLMARDKPDGSVRVIVELSWPLGASVNSCIPSDVYDNILFKLKYPTIDQVVECIKEIGPSAKLFKIDLERAFRNLRVDPYDYPLMGLQWDGDVYVGISLGFKMGTAACQMCTDAITLTLCRRHIWLMNYMHDYVGVATALQAKSYFLSLSNILQYVGLPIDQKKIETLSSVISSLGIVLYCVFILSAISSYTTGLKVLLNPSD